MALYVPNDEAAQIAADLIPKYHPRLTGIEISHLLNVKAPKKVSKNGKSTGKQQRKDKKITIAKCSKVSAKTCAVAEKDVHFVIEYDSLIWDALPPDKKQAVVDHELGHCGNDADGTYMVPHSLEDFKFMLERYGFWKSDVEDFARTVISVAAKQNGEIGHLEETADEQSGD